MNAKTAMTPLPPEEPKKTRVAELVGALLADPEAARVPDAATSYDAPREAKASRRARLWELPQKLHCPVIGTCLTPRELARIARRHQVPHDPSDAYALHVEAVGWAAQRSAATRDLQRYLDGKYAADIARFEAARDANELLALWKTHWQAGRVAGPMWAALTHPAADEHARHVVYADVHMLSHQVGAGLAADTRRLHEQAREIEALKALLAASREACAQSQGQARVLGAELQQAQAELAEARQRIAHLQQRVAEFESGQALVELGERVRRLTALNEELRTLAQRVRPLQDALAQERQRAAQLARERDELRAARAALERLLISEENGGCDGAPCAEVPAAARGRCVLYVGGRTAQVSHYRQLAERFGLRLIHHDGGREEALSRLPELIAAADAVLCPTDCVSHGAYYMLKRVCKRTGKPCLLFRGAGISSFAVALARVATGEASIGGIAADAADAAERIEEI